MGRCYYPCYILADVIAFINVIVIGKTLHIYIVCLWQMLLPSGKMEQPHLFCLELVDVVAMWQDVKATLILCMADVIAKWQML